MNNLMYFESWILYIKLKYRSAQLKIRDDKLIL